jgi:hypothetical protein
MRSILNPATISKSLYAVVILAIGIQLLNFIVESIVENYSKKDAMKRLLAFVWLTLLLILTANLVSAAEIKHSSKGFAYVTGGIGDEETTSLQQSQKQFNLHLLFSIGDGEAATNVDVRIFDSKNQLIFRLLGASPRLNIRLPADTYGIVATLDGEKQSSRFTLEKNGTKRIILNWKDANPAEALPTEELTAD